MQGKVDTITLIGSDINRICNKPRFFYHSVKLSPIQSPTVLNPLPSRTDISPTVPPRRNTSNPSRHSTYTYTILKCLDVCVWEDMLFVYTLGICQTSIVTRSQVKTQNQYTIPIHITTINSFDHFPGTLERHDKNVEHSDFNKVLFTKFIVKKFCTR